MNSINLPSWIADRSPFHFDEIDVSRTALLVIDLQVGLVASEQPFAVPAASTILPQVERIAGAVRQGGGLVIFTRHSFADDGPKAIAAWQRRTPVLTKMAEIFRPGFDGHAIDPRLFIAEDDIVIDKYRFSALAPNSSNLQAILEERGIDTVIVAGVVTNCCCETTARDASMMGFQTFLVSDASAAMTDEEHNAALLNLAMAFADIRDTDAMVELLNRSAGFARSQASRPTAA